MTNKKTWLDRVRVDGGKVAEPPAPAKGPGRTKMVQGARQATGVCLLLLGAGATLLGVGVWALLAVLSPLGGFMSDNPKPVQIPQFPFVVLLPVMTLGAFGWLMMKTAREAERGEGDGQDAERAEAASAWRGLKNIIGLVIIGWVVWIFISVFI